MSNVRTWVRWIQFGAIAIVAGSIAASYLMGDGFSGAFAAIDRVFLIAVVGVVGVCVIGLGWQALANLVRSPTEGMTGPVEVAMQRSRRSAWVVVAILVVGGIAAAWWYLTGAGRDLDFAAVTAWDLQFQAIAGLFVLIWAVLLLGFLSMAIRSAPWFVLTPRGFLYAPGGMSPGFVHWEDVTGLRETEIVSGRGRDSPKLERILAVGLRDPAKYATRYNPILAALVRKGGALYRTQTGGAADILIDPSHFGDRYDAIRARMIALHAEAKH
jgi:hypothetical protein